MPTQDKSKKQVGKKGVPKILPREPLTEKAFKGIEAYALYKCKGLRIYTLLIKYTLEAERMRREDLYSWLEKHGYKWFSGSHWGNEKITEEGERINDKDNS